MPHELLDGFTATLRNVTYAPELEACPDRPHPFIYFIALDNQSQQTVRLQGRKWIIRDTLGYVMVVEGEGVVGEFPVLTPGETFEYNSYLTIGADSTVYGSFFGLADDNRQVMAKLPAFKLKAPGG